MDGQVVVGDPVPQDPVPHYNPGTQEWNHAIYVSELHIGAWCIKLIVQEDVVAVQNNVLLA